MNVSARQIVTNNKSAIARLWNNFLFVWINTFDHCNDRDSFRVYRFHDSYSNAINKKLKNQEIHFTRSFDAWFFLLFANKSMHFSQFETNVSKNRFEWHLIVEYNFNNEMHKLIALNDMSFEIKQQDDVTIDNDVLFAHSIVLEIISLSNFMTINNVTQLIINSKEIEFSTQIQVRSCNSFRATSIYFFAFVILRSISQTRIAWDLNTTLRESEKKERKLKKKQRIWFWYFHMHKIDRVDDVLQTWRRLKTSTYSCLDR